MPTPSRPIKPGECRFITCGNVNGNIQSLFSKIVKIIHHMGPIDAVFCVGDFIGEDPTEYEMCRNGRLNCPVPTFFMGPTNPAHKSLYPCVNGATISTNLFYIGRRGVISTMTGACIAYCSGVDPDGTGQDEPLDIDDDSRHTLRMSDVEAIERIVRARGNITVDVLLTSAAPAGITGFNVKEAFEINNKHCSAVVTQLALRLKPRYHFFDAKDIYFAPQSYRNYSIDRHLPVTRLVGLSSPHNTRGIKGLYAFQITSLKNLAPLLPLSGFAESVECPYYGAIIPSQSLNSQQMSLNHVTMPAGSTIPQVQYLFDFHPQGAMLAPQHALGQQTLAFPGSSAFGPHSPYLTNPSFEQMFNHLSPAMSPTHIRPHRSTYYIHNSIDHTIACDVVNPTCWFCMGEPCHEEHLVVSVGTLCYLALSKGGITKEHLMIVPLEHVSSSRLISQFVLEDIEKYKASLVEFFVKERDCYPIFFERSFKTVHFQIQCVPIPKSKIDIIEEIFEDYANQLKLTCTRISRKDHLVKSVSDNSPFFIADLPNSTRLLVKGNDNNLHLHFGRIVLGSKRMLNTKKGAFDWKVCMRPRDEEELIVAEIARDYAPYDVGKRT